MKYAKRLDANHTDIVHSLEKVGVCVLDLSGAGNGILDLITHHSHTVLIELKYGAKAELKKSQMELLSRWTGYCGIATSFEEAERLAKQPEHYALTRQQQLKIAMFLAKWEGKRLHLGTFIKEVLIND